MNNRFTKIASLVLTLGTLSLAGITLNNTAFADTSASPSTTSPSLQTPVKNNLTTPTDSQADNKAASANQQAANPSQTAKLTLKDKKTYLSSSVLKNFALPKSLQKTLTFNDKYNQYVDDLVFDIKELHFNHVDFANDPQAQAKLLKIYLETLDPSKVFFTLEDVSYFKQHYQAGLYDNVSYAYKIYAVFIKRVTEYNYATAKLLLSETNMPNINTNLTQLKAKYRDYYPASFTDQKIKDSLLANIISTKLDKPSFTWDQLRVRIMKGLIFEQKVINNYAASDVLKIYGNTFALAADTHSEYFTPSNISEFQQQISSSFIGIGVTVTQDRTGVIKFPSIVKGGPAWKNGQVAKGDELLSVSQDGVKFVDVTEMSLPKVIKMLKGPRNTSVWITLLSKEGHIKVVKVDRGEVPLNQIKASLETYEQNGKTYGVLHFGSFYEGLDRDVSKLLDQHSNLAGLIIDLRNNGGGLVSELLGISSSFLGNLKPVFQTTNDAKAQGGSPKLSFPTSSNHYQSVSFKGPIIVLTNAQSASASEIFASAIQDYRRGIIMGSQTFGKGTVQAPNYVNLRAYNPDYSEGIIKLTIQKFFRVTGKTTQFVGVTPDVLLPPIFDRSEVSEQASINPLPYSTINPVLFNSYNNKFVSPQIITDLNNYVANYSHTNKDYEEYVDVNRQLIDYSKSHYVYLNYDKLNAFDHLADDYRVKAYNLYAQEHKLPEVKDIDQLEALGPDKTLDPYLDLARQILPVYVSLVNNGTGSYAKVQLDPSLTTQNSKYMDKAVQGAVLVRAPQVKAQAGN